MLRRAHALAVALATFGGTACSLLAPSDAELMGGVVAPATVTCGLAEKACGSSCVSLASPETGCGAASCDPCTFDHGGPLCIGGACALGACESGFADCDGVAGNGCEASLRTSADHCGTCARQCVFSTPYCDLGACVARCSAIRFVVPTAREHAGAIEPALGDGDFTFETWVRWHGTFPTAATGTGNLFTTNEGSRPDSFTLDCRASGDSLRCACLLATGSKVDEARVDVPVDGWHHVACVRNGPSLTAYGDGAAGSSTTTDVTLTAASGIAMGSTVELRAEPVSLGPTRLSRVARYAGPFLPARSFTVDPSTVLQYLVTRPFVTMFLVDESGNGHDLGGSTLDTHAETPSPCE